MAHETFSVSLYLLCLTGGKMGTYDVVIVLGAAVWPGGEPSPVLRRRILYGVERWRESSDRWLLVTGGLGRHAPAEAQVMRQVALTAGVPDDSIVIEECATSTFWSAIYAARLWRQYGWSAALIVTDRYHLPRALLTFRSLGMRVSGAATIPCRRPLRQRAFCVAWGREIVALPWYVVKLMLWKVQHREQRFC